MRLEQMLKDAYAGGYVDRHDKTEDTPADPVEIETAYKSYAEWVGLGEQVRRYRARGEIL